MSRNRNKKMLRTNNSEMQQAKDYTVVIQRICKPGEVNANKVKYDIDSYRNALEQAKKTYTCKRSEIFFGDGSYPENTKFSQIVLENSRYNEILSIADDSITYKILDDELLDIIKEKIKNNEVYTEMRSVGDLIKTEGEIKTYKLLRIVAFDIKILGEFPYKTLDEYIRMRKHVTRE